MPAMKSWNEPKLGADTPVAGVAGAGSAAFFFAFLPIAPACVGRIGMGSSKRRDYPLYIAYIDRTQEAD
jgi:hypothetical protein